MSRQGCHSPLGHRAVPAPQAQAQRVRGTQGARAQRPHQLLRGEGDKGQGVTRVPLCHHGSPRGHLTSFQARLRSSGTTWVLLELPVWGQEGLVAPQAGDTGVPGEAPRTGTLSTVPRCGWHCPVTPGGHPRMANATWPVPPCATGTATAVSPAPHPTVPRKQTDSRTPGPKPVAPGMWTATTWHRNMATECWHRGRSCHWGLPPMGHPLCHW